MGVYWAKPTLEDIASQRAMLERGEEKRRAAKQAEERERLRDTFAAAALTGLLARYPKAPSDVGEVAYAAADLMLREREQTNHDALPEAKATTTPLNKGAACNTATSGTGNTGESLSGSLPGYLGDGVSPSHNDKNLHHTQRPVAWARFFPNGGPMSVFLDRPPADAEPLYRSPTLTDAEREAISEVVDCLAESGTSLASPTATRNTLAALLERMK